MSAFTQAQPPSTTVTEIPGRYSPIYVVDKRGLSTSSLGSVSMVPVQTAPATATTGGTILAGTYYIVITAIYTLNGVTVETMASNEMSQVTTGSTSTLTANWTSVANATGGYRVWVGTASGSEVLAGSVAFGTNTLTLTAPVVGTATPSIFKNSTTTNSQSVQLYRAESVDSTLDTPTTPVIELGTNFHVNEYDDLAESKMTLQSYDVSTTNLAVITGKSAPAGAFTSTFTFNDLATAVVDVHRQFADPNGNVFASMFMSDMVLSEFGVSLKAKSTAMESYSLQGFNMLLFRGFTITKAIVVTATDVTNGYLLVSSVFGTNEGAVALPVPSGNQPASYWIQRGCYNFLKIDRFRAGVGFKRFPETTGAVAAGLVKYTSGTTHLQFNSGDFLAGDIIFLTYCSYGSNVANYNTIPQQSADTSDPAAVSTRLTPFTISANNVQRGQSLDLKIAMKRDRAEGIGDVDGIWGPPDAPEVSLSLDVKMTDMGLNSLMVTGSPNGTDNGGTVSGDFFDPNYMTRNQITSATPIAVNINDPRNSGTVLKTYNCPTALFKNYNNQAQGKSPVSAKYTGVDKVGNCTVTVTKA